MGMCTVNFALLKVFNLKLSDTVKNGAWRRLNCLEDAVMRLQMMTNFYEPLAATR